MSNESFVAFTGAAAIPTELALAEQYVAHAPFSLAIRELNRIQALRIVSEKYRLKPKEVLDVGCGDGFWWGLSPLNRQVEVYGVDISHAELAKAKTRIVAEYCDVSKSRPFQGKQFQFVLGNCSLEHVPDIQGALNHVHQSLEVGGYLVLFVPTPRWAYQGIVQGFFLKHFPRIAMMISGMMNGFFQHWHLYDDKVWKALLKNSNLELQESFGLGGKRSEFMFRLFLFPALLAFFFKKLFGIYPNQGFAFLPMMFRRPLARLLTWSLETSFVATGDDSAYETCLVARRVL